MSQHLVPLFENNARVDSYFVDPDTRIIYFAKSFDGRTIKFSCKVKVPNILGAKRFAAKKLRDRLGVRKTRVTSLIKDEIPFYLRVKESEGLDEGTLINIRQAIKRIEPFWGERFPYEINRDTLHEW